MMPLFSMPSNGLKSTSRPGSQKPPLASPATHDLLMLYQLVVPVEPNWQVLANTPRFSQLRLPWRIAILAASPPELMPETPSPIAEKCDA